MHLQIKTDKNKVAGSFGVTVKLLKYFTLIKIIKK